MKPPFPLLCLFALFMALGCAEEELMFFADDHYKAIGEPELLASAINPVLDQGNNSTLRVILANAGRLSELIPTQLGGNETDISREALEELHSVDAENVTAKLSGSGPVVVTSGPHSLASLPSGGAAHLNFSITSGNGAEGWYSLMLDLEYEHQMDVKVSNGSASSLYRPANVGQKISILIPAPGQSFKVEGVSSDLYPGANSTILAVIKNEGSKVARNCSARLLATPPFRSVSQRTHLGDVPPGQAFVVRLPVAVDGKAAIGEYRLACEMASDDQTAMVSIPVLLENRPNLFPDGLLAVGALILAIGLIALLWSKRGPRRTLRRLKRWWPLR
jgi:hypothetical protein